MTESQSWADKAQEVFQKPGSWSPDRPYPDDPHDNRHNSQVGHCRVQVHVYVCVVTKATAI